MSKQEKGGWRPPPLGKILWTCPNCGEFNAADKPICGKCGADKVVDEKLAGASDKPIGDDERRVFN